MTALPVISHGVPAATVRQLYRVRLLAGRLRRERPELRVSAEFAALQPARIEDGPCLAVDDLSGLRGFDPIGDITCLQHRARLRAGDGDFVASGVAPPSSFETYCQDSLGLGSANWLIPQSVTHPAWVAAGCWKDLDIRHRLISAVKDGALRYIHPYLGNLPTWELAVLLSRASGRPIEVVAPPPSVARWVNDKLAFADVVRRLLGSDRVPETARAPNFVTLAYQVRRMAETSNMIALKLPDSLGGRGNLVLPADLFRGRSLTEIRQSLKEMMIGKQWRGDRPLLVSHWSDRVLVAASAHFWIPPPAEGEPIFEGLFEQLLTGPQHRWHGGRPASLPKGTTSEILTGGWLLACLYQQLGYVGRCGFDVVVVDDDTESGHVQFIECNGRWGAMSVVMTLLNRLFGDWQNCSFTAGTVHLGNARTATVDLLDVLGPDLWRAGTGRGTVILCGPTCATEEVGAEVVILNEAFTVEDLENHIRRLLKGSSLERPLNPRSAPAVTHGAAPDKGQAPAR